jgi:peptidyl-prolyl cis-trans isomerase C
MNSSSENESTEKNLQDIKEITVNGTVISPAEIIQEMSHHSTDSPEDMIKKSSEVLITQLLLVQKAQELGLNKRLPKDSDIPLEETIIGRLIEKEIAKSDEVSEEECEKYYDEHKIEFFTQEMLELRHILIGATPEKKNERSQAKKLAESLILKLKDSLDQFDFLVDEHSICPSKETGGALGRIGRGQTPPEFEKIVFALGKGLADKPVKSNFGFHVVCIDKKIPAKQLDYDQVKSDIADMLIEIGHRIEISKYIHQLIDTADIQGVDFTIGRPS